MIKTYSTEERAIRTLYQAHRGVAKQRNVPFNLSIEEWYAFWQASGHWDERGMGRGKYCMSRVNDEGPYVIGNVFIQLHTKNVLDAQLGRKHTKEHIANWRKSFCKSVTT